MEEIQRLHLILEAVNYCKKVRDMGMPSAAYSKALREPIHYLWEIKDGPKVKVAKTLGLKMQLDLSTEIMKLYTITQFHLTTLKRFF